MDIKRVINPSWKQRAICHDVPDDHYMVGRYADLPKLQQFIEDYCMFCPVAQECIDDSWSLTISGNGTTDEMFWTVRGGYLPTSQVTRPQGRPPKSMPTVLESPPEESNARLCKNGLHRMTPENIIIKRDSKKCRACYSKSQHKPKKACRNGHTWTERSTEYTVTGKRRCLDCLNEREGQERCERGHFSKRVKMMGKWKCEACITGAGHGTLVA